MLNLGSMDVVCPHCSALFWKGELPKGAQKFASCCKNGDVAIEPLAPLPTYLADLFFISNPLGKHFRKHIRKYASLFAFTATRCKTPESLRNQGGIFPFTIQGKIYHFQGGLEALSQQEPNFAQVMMYDPEMASAARANSVRARGLESSVINELTTLIHQVNPFVQIYQMAFEILRNQPESTVILNAQLKLILQGGSDARVYNLPTADEVAALIHYPIGAAVTESTNIALRLRCPEGTSWSMINCTHSAYLSFAMFCCFQLVNLGGIRNCSYKILLAPGH